jgi:ferredoxin-NADP reductase
MPSLLVAHHRPGFYLRVITEGVIEAGDEIIQTVRGPHQISVADLDALLYLPHRDLDLMRRAVEIPALSPGWQSSFHELLAAPDGSAAGPAIGVEPGWTGFRPLRVTRVVAESSAVTSFYLEAADGAALPAALPGQYLTLRVSGAGAPAPVRNYSLSSAPRSGPYRISVKRETHGLVSRYLHTQVQAGSLVEAAAPRGDFVLHDGTEPVVLISAGVGVTPVMAMLEQLVAVKSAREVWWIHAARNQREHALAHEADELLNSLAHAQKYVYYSAPESTPPVSRHIRNGRLTAAQLSSLGLPHDAAAYICGPAGFMSDVEQALQAGGLAAAQIHTELFGALGAINPGVINHIVKAPHQPPGKPGTGPLITFARSALSTRADDRHRSLLETAELCDVPTRFSCRTGVCHTCVTALLSGEIEYAPEPLELPPSGEVLVCVARPVTDVVLEM